jgi:hypothetical protein
LGDRVGELARVSAVLVETHLAPEALFAFRRRLSQ